MPKSGPLLLWIPILLSLLNISCQSPTTSISVSPEVLDVGIKTSNDSIFGTYWVKNTGKNPLRISQIETDCDCLIPNIPLKSSIVPGDSIAIKILFQNPQYLGFFRRVIEIHANVDNTPKVCLFLGEIQR